MFFHIIMFFHQKSDAWNKETYLDLYTDVSNKCKYHWIIKSYSLQM